MDKFLIAHLVLGPVLLVLSFIIKIFPPKSINGFYGYRTPRSMRSQEAWKEANRYAGQYTVIISGLTILTQIVTYTLIGGETSIHISVGFLVVALLLMIVATERHLKKLGH